MHMKVDRVYHSWRDYRQWQRAISWFSQEVPLMLEPELSGLLDSIPGAINDTDAVLLGVLEVLEGALFFAKGWENDALEFFLFVEGGEEFKPLEFFSGTLFGIAMSEVDHEELDSLFRFGYLFPLSVSLLFRVEFTLLLLLWALLALFLILLIFLIIWVVVLVWVLMFSFGLCNSYFLVEFFLDCFIIVIAFAFVVLCLFVGFFVLSLHWLMLWFYYFRVINRSTFIDFSMVSIIMFRNDLIKPKIKIAKLSFPF